MTSKQLHEQAIANVAAAYAKLIAAGKGERINFNALARELQTANAAVTELARREVSGELK